MSQIQSNAESPDVPGGRDIATPAAHVSPRFGMARCPRRDAKKDVDALHKAGHDGPKRS
jgi:hypothetical protein